MLRKIGLSLLSLVVLILVVGTLLIDALTYKASERALQAMQDQPLYEYNMHTTYAHFDVKNEQGAILFYPGGLVESAAYSALCAQLATRLQYDVYLVDFFWNLGVFGINNAQNILDHHQADHWVMMGHSLGGVMGYEYAHTHDEIEAMVFLASYPNQKMRGLPVLALQGSNDTVLKLEAQSLQNFSPMSQFEMIQGGNHAGFGDYGPQSGDGVLARNDQQKVTVEAVEAFLREWKLLD